MYVHDEVEIRQKPMGVPYGRHGDPASHSYVNLRDNPESIDLLPEFRDSIPLREFVRALNMPSSPYQTFGCAKWSEAWSNPLFPDFITRFGSYVDFAFADVSLCGSADAYQSLIAEFREYTVVNRSYDVMHTGFEITPTVNATNQWFTLSYYNFGMGRSAAESERWWAEGLSYFQRFLFSR